MIPPGGKGKIKVKIDTKEYEGRISKKVYVMTEDLREFFLVVNADIVAPIKVSPKKVYFVGRKDKVLTSEVKIEANLNRPLIIKPASFDLNGKVGYRIEEVKKGKVYKILLKKFPLSERKISGELKLKTNYPEIPYISIKIKGYFR